MNWIINLFLQCYLPLPNKYDWMCCSRQHKLIWIQRHHLYTVRREFSILALASSILFHVCVESPVKFFSPYQEGTQSSLHCLRVWNVFTMKQSVNLSLTCQIHSLCTVNSDNRVIKRANNGYILLEMTIVIVVIHLINTSNKETQSTCFYCIQTTCAYWRVCHLWKHIIKSI